MKNAGIYAYNSGLQNESELLLSLNNKKFQELTPHLQQIIQAMFGYVNDDDLVRAEKVSNFAKPDLKISIGDDSHYLSVKHGFSSVVHTEDIEKFVERLKANGFSDRVIECFKLYHYGDMTTDGSGIRSMSQQEVLNVFYREVEELNEALNHNRFFVRDIVKLAVFEGNDPDKPSADFIYHGDIEEGEICSKDSVLRYAKNKKSTGLVNAHIGQLMVRPYARYASGHAKHPEKRHKVVFEWHYMEKDFKYIRTWKY